MSRILVADDSTTTRRIIARSLAASAAGVEVCEACDGVETLSVFSRNEFQLVLLDGRMPGLSGLDLIREIRGLDPQVPIIVMAAEHERSCTAEAIEAGATDVLVKPFTPDMLREKLEKHGCAAASS